MTLTNVSLFSGVGGFDLAAEWSGFRTVLLCEIDPWCQVVLRHHWPGVPIIPDVKDVTDDTVRQALADAAGYGCPQHPGQQSYSEAEKGRMLQSVASGKANIREGLTLITASPPCQPVSCAGKRRGKKDDRWLWHETIRVLAEVKPHWCCFENPAGIITMGLDGVLSDMEGAGYACETVIVPACAVNAPHRRDRVFIVAHNDGSRCHRQPYEQGEGQAGRGRVAEGVAADTTSITQREQDDAQNAESGSGNARQVSERGGGAAIPDAVGIGFGSSRNGRDTTCKSRLACSSGGRKWHSQSGLRCLDDGLPGRLAGLPDWYGGDWQMPPPLAHEREGRVNKLKVLGNAVVPQQVYPILAAIAEQEARQ